MNLKIRMLENQLVELLNNSDIDIEAKRLLLENILSKVKEKADEIIALEMQENKKPESIKEEGEYNAEST